jgi:hypothetical protein
MCGLPGVRWAWEMGFMSRLFDSAFLHSAARDARFGSAKARIDLGSLGRKG